MQFRLISRDKFLNLFDLKCLSNHCRIKFKSGIRDRVYLHKEKKVSGVKAAKKRGNALNVRHEVSHMILSRRCDAHCACPYYQGIPWR